MLKSGILICDRFGVSVVFVGTWYIWWGYDLYLFFLLVFLNRFKFIVKRNVILFFFMFFVLFNFKRIYE